MGALLTNFIGCEAAQFRGLAEPIYIQRAILPEPYRIQRDQHFPVAQLPVTVEADAGKLSLCADYTDTTDLSITIYIINKSSKELLIPTSDGNPYIKLESLNRKSTWDRAQSHQDYMGCDMGIYHTVLPPNSFFKVSAPFYTEGKPSTIRYKMYNSARYPDGGSTEALSLASNQSQGFVIPSVIRACKSDRLAMQIQNESEK